VPKYLTLGTLSSYIMICWKQENTSNLPCALTTRFLLWEINEWNECTHAHMLTCIRTIPFRFRSSCDLDMWQTQFLCVSGTSEVSPDTTVAPGSSNTCEFTVWKRLFWVCLSFWYVYACTPNFYSFLHESFMSFLC
jgi:hypothetical protein